MREAKIIFPVECGAKLHSRLRRILAHRFGGYTATEGDGGWLDEAGELINERVVVYTIAMEPTLTHADIVCQIAANMGRAGEQDCVYVQLPYGHVFLIYTDTDHAVSAAEQRAALESAR